VRISLDELCASGKGVVEPAIVPPSASFPWETHAPACDWSAGNAISMDAVTHPLYDGSWAHVFVEDVSDWCMPPVFPVPPEQFHAQTALQLDRLLSHPDCKTSDLISRAVAPCTLVPQCAPPSMPPPEILPICA
jgi:hypothetical protein